MPPPFLTIDPRTSPITLSPFPSPKISPKSDTDDLGPRQDDDDLVSPLTPNDYSRLSGFPQLSNFDFAFDDRSSLNNLPSPSGSRRPSETTSVEQLVRPAPVAQNSPPASSPSIAAPAAPVAPPQLSIVVPSNAVAGGVHRPAVATVEDAEAPPPYSRYAGASQPPPAPGTAWGGAAARVAGVQNMPPVAPAAVYTRGHQGFASAAGAPINGNPRRQSGQRGLHALALADQSQQQQGGQLSKQDTWREKITAGYWETEVEVETGSENKRLTRKGRRCIFAATGLVILVMAIVAIVVGVVTTRKNKHDSDSNGAPREPSAVQSFPELPEGTYVIKLQGRPKKLDSCVSPSSLWSCDLPSDSLFSTTVSPSNHSAPSESHFTINIRKGTEPSTGPNYYISLVTQDSSSIEHDSGQTPSPVSSSAPSRTPETLLLSKPPRRRGLRFKRQDSSAPAKNLLPEIAKDQPLQFFDGGNDTEHYEFQTHYTKTIRIPSPAESSASDPTGRLPSDAGPGTYEWEQTRFKIVIWTKKRSDVDSQASDDFPFAVSIVEDRDDEKGPITYKYGPDQSKTIQEKSGEAARCLCEWRS